MPWAAPTEKTSGLRLAAPGLNDATAAKPTPTQTKKGWRDALAAGRAAVACDLRLQAGYSHHLAWAGAGAALGACGLLALRTVASATVQASLMGATALGLQVAIVALLLFRAGAVALAGATALTAEAASSSAPPTWQGTAPLAVLVGVSVAPLGFGVVGLGAAIAGGVLATTALAAHAAWRLGHLTAGFDFRTLATVAAQAAAAPVAWSLAAGTAVGAALATAAITFPVLLAGVTAANFVYFNVIRTSLTPYADSHKVPDAVVQAARADCLGEPNPTIRQVPPALVAKIEAMQNLLRLDKDRKPYWLGMPMVTLDGPPGTGKTSLALALAQKLDADLLATSASVLNRAYLPGLPTGLVRAVTLLAQAEQRAIRTGRLQGVFIDEMGALFPRGIDVSSADGLADLQGRFLAMLALHLQGGRRSGVFVVLADNHAHKSMDALLAFSPMPPVHVGPPGAAALEQIFAQKLENSLVALTQKWKVQWPAQAALRPQAEKLRCAVGELATVAGVGRDASGVVSQMRRAAEAQLLDVADVASAGGPVWAAMVAQGHGAVANYRRRRTQQANAARPSLPPPSLDVDAVEGAVRKLVRQFSEGGATAIVESMLASFSVSTDVQQSVDAVRVVGGFQNAMDYLSKRFYADIGYTTELLDKMSKAEERYDPLHDPLTGPAKMQEPVRDWNNRGYEDLQRDHREKIREMFCRDWDRIAAELDANAHDPVAHRASLDALVASRDREKELAARRYVPTPADQQRVMAARAKRFAEQFEPVDYFADTTFATTLKASERLLARLIGRPRAAPGEADPYARLSSMQLLYVQLRQRFNGERRDTYRSELMSFYWDRPLPVTQG